MTTADDPPHSEDPVHSEALTYAFADPAGDVCGVARLGHAQGVASGLAIVLAGGEPVAVRAESGVEPAGESWDDVRAAGLSTSEHEPGAAWSLQLDGDCELDLRFEALAAPFALTADSPAARAGGMEGLDRFCRVEGTAAGRRFAGLGQRGRSWGTPDWERMALARTLTAWFDPGHAVSAVAVRPAATADHAAEAVFAVLLDADADGEPVREVAEARVSTAFDAEGRQRRAGLELFVGDDDAFAHRAAGEVIAGTSLDLGRLRLDCAFLRWRMGGREGVGRYDVLRRVS